MWDGEERDILFTAYSVDLLRSDLQTLKPGTWLNDEIVNMWMNLLNTRDKKRVKASGIRSSHFFM